ncbi:MAG: TonB-dependent receptor [Bacteroidota bacterium]
MPLFLLLLGLNDLAAQQTVTKAFTGTPLAEVFELFTEEYGLLLSYDPQILDGRAIDLQLEQEPLLQAFYQVLAAAHLDYLTLDRQRILIRPAPPPPPPPLSYWQIRGQVRDQLTGEGLPLATVYCAQYGWGASTDERGYYQLSIPDTIKHSLAVEGRYLGYETVRQRFRPGPDRRVNFTLTASTQEISMIIVTDEVPTVGLANREQAVVMRPDDALPALGGSSDLMRNLQLMPGINSANDQSAALQVRGGQASENLILWDGMLLYNVDHLFGIFSSVNSSLVESVRLYKNTFPIAYAGRSASVLEIKSHEPDQQAHAYLNLGNLVAEGAARVPLGKAWGLQLGARSSLNRLVNTDLFDQLSQRVSIGGANLEDLLSESEQIQIQPAFRFSDFNAKLSWQASPRTYFDFNTYLSSDRYNYDYTFDFATRLPNRRGENSIRFTELSEWKNQAYSGRWQQQWNEIWQSELTLGYSNFELFEKGETTLVREQSNGNFKRSNRLNQRENEIEGYHLNWKHTVQTSADGLLTLGTRVLEEEVALQLSNDSLGLLANSAKAQQLGLYGAHEWQWKKWQLQLGLHLTRYSGTDQFYASPRLLVGLESSENWYWKASLNLYHQYLRHYYTENRFGRSFQVWTLANENFWPVSQTQQAMLGFTYRKNRFSLDVESFYRSTSGVLEYTALANSFEDTATGGAATGQNSFRISQGDGQVIGVDILLRQKWEHFQSYLAYTLSRSTRQFDDLFQGQAYASQDDRPHQLQWTNTWSNGRWAFSGIYVLASGRPYLDLTNSNLPVDRRDRTPEDLRRIPDYHRIDLSARYEILLGKTRLHASLAVLNLLDRDNTYYEQQVYSIPGQNNRSFLLGNELQLLQRTWSVAVGVEF